MYYTTVLCTILKLYCTMYHFKLYLCPNGHGPFVIVCYIFLTLFDTYAG